MSTSGFALFETTIGTCGIAWANDLVLATQLPDRNADATRARLARRRPDVAETLPSPAVQDAIERIAAHLRGESGNLDAITLDMDGLPALNRAVYDIARRIPSGKTLTYGEIAREVGSLGDARAVGHALGQNPFPIVIPCHRVLAAGGKAGGFSAPGSVTTKFRLLEIEGARIPDEKSGGTPTLFDVALSVAPPRRQR